MPIYAISDLHLSIGMPNKAMDVFGPGWRGYMDRIEDEWRGLVGEGDYVLMPGDFSWAMRIEDALPDFLFLEGLPGKKILSKGNHDYWWTTMTKMRGFLSAHNLKTIDFLHNDSYVTDGGVGVAAARGWLCPGAPGFCEQDEKIYLRELIRLRLSIDSLKRRETAGKLILMLHYPPMNFKKATGFSEIIGECKPDLCLYGHLHGETAATAFEGRALSTEYRLVSADHLRFKPLLILGSGD